MTTVFEHPDGRAEIMELPGGKHRITIYSEKFTLPAIDQNIETDYPVELIQKFFTVKGPRSVNDEIRREQDPYYTKICLKTELLAYLSPADCNNKRILDFGCGAGASGVILARLFPNASIVGIDLEPDLIELAKARSDYFGFENLTFHCCPSGKELPASLDTFDIIVLSAVFEHLLPDERTVVLQQIWNHLNSDGILFINQTPYRWFPFEGHTSQLPLVNYLPAKLALAAARRFSKRVKKNETWDGLLRRGIRGCTTHGIIRILKKTNAEYVPKVLRPSYPGLRDRIDIWYNGYAVSIAHKYPKTRRLQKIIRIVAKVIYRLTGIVFLPTLAMAIRKTPKTK